MPGARRSIPSTLEGEVRLRPLPFQIALQDLQTNSKIAALLPYFVYVVSGVSGRAGRSVEVAVQCVGAPLSAPSSPR